MKRYIAVMHADGHSGYGISFPDFPGCISAGKDWPSTIENGTQALRAHVELMREDGLAIPAPRDLATLRADPEFRDDFEGAIVAPVPLLPEPGKLERVNVVLGKNLLREIDAAAKRLGMNRSVFLARSAEQLLESGAGQSLDAAPGAKRPAKSRKRA